MSVMEVALAHLLFPASAPSSLDPKYDARFSGSEVRCNPTLLVTTVSVAGALPASNRIHGDGRVRWSFGKAGISYGISLAGKLL